MDERNKRIEAIFHAMMDLESNGDRERYLKDVCADDADLCREVEELLRAAVAAEPVFQAGRDACQVAEATFAAGLAEQPGDWIGRYRLLERIGEGGMGVVYMAEQSEPVRRKVALKIIKLGMDTRQVVARFEAERQALALMDHPNIAKVLDGGATDTGRPYFVMELVEGVPITEFCDQNRLSIEERLKLYLPVCHAIQSAHQKGIIHRDIKPSNVLVTMHHGAPHPMVIDFGVAKAIGQKLTEKTLFTSFATMIGTPAYMSPEQAEMSRLDVDTRSDIYSLGVLLYELMTSTTPFHEERLRSVGYGEMQRIIAEEAPERPSTRRRKSGQAASAAHLLKSAIDSDVDWIVMKCLEKDRTRRYETASGLAADINRYLANEPVVARPPSRLYEFRKTVRRHQVGFAATALVILALAGGVAVSTRYAVQAERARKVAVFERQRADEQAEIARAVNSFLQQDLIGQADSWSQTGSGFAADPNLTVRIALDRAAQRIGERFSRQPLVEAGIRMAVGKAYLALGQPRQAVPHLEAACALLRSRLGPAHPDLLASQSALAEAYTSTERPKEGAQMLERVMAQQRESVGSEHPDTLQSAERLVYAYKQISLSERAFATQAISLGKPILASRRAQYGHDHPATVKILNLLADAYLAAGRAGDALALVEPALPDIREKLGPGHPEVLVGVHMLARAYLYGGLPGKAVPLFEQNLASGIATFGTNHHYIVDATLGLGDAYAANGQPEKAIATYEQALASARTLSSGLVEVCRILLARCYLRARQFEKGVPLLEEVLAAAPQPARPGEVWMLESLDQLVQACCETGYGHKALPLLEDIVVWQQQHLPEDDRRLLSNLKRLATVHQDLGDWEKALPLLRAALNRAKGGPPESLISAGHELAVLLRAQGDADQARSCYRALGPMLEEVTAGVDDRLSSEALNEIAWLLATSPDSMLRDGSRAVGFAEKAVWLSGRKHAGFLDTLAASYAAAGRFSDAVRIQQEAIEQSQDDPERDDLQGRLQLYLAGKAYHSASLGEAAARLLTTAASHQLRAGHPARAEALAREASSLWGAERPGSRGHVESRSLLGAALLGQKRYADGERVLLSCYESLRQSSPVTARDVLKDVVGNLVQLYQATERPEEAAFWKRRLIQGDPSPGSSEPDAG